MKYFNTLVLFASVFCLLAFPLLIGDPYTDTIAVNVLLIAGAAVAWNIFSGYTGYISLGHATYAGIGAYSLAIVCQDWNIPGGWGPFLLLPLVGLIVGVLAVPLGWIVLHAERYTFLIITIAIFFIFQLLAYNLQNVTGGSSGIYLPNPDWSNLSLPFYFVACVLLLIGMFISWWIRHSKFGLGLLAIRDDEDRAYGLGIRTDQYKLGAYVISAILIGMEGAISIYFLGYTIPSVAFDKSFDLTIVAATFLGGIGTVLGPLVGGLLFAPIQTFLIQQFGVVATGLDQILFGSFLLVIILLLPEGIVPAMRNRWEVWQGSHFKLQSRVGRTQLPPISATLIPVSELFDLVDEKNTNEHIVSVPRSSKVGWAIPHIPNRQAVLLQPSMAVSQKMKAQRLVPLSPAESITKQEPITFNPVVSWRCPLCRRPLLLRGETCYCPRCNYTRSFTDGIQPMLPPISST